ncbi:CocE/NonD family hydrolase [Dokdonella ginsengisoli]|uniref:CocE/NonD family hydrolase n=1 Tax=Dokdonella ginsengisoli TaxID=363846 RepID=A0ABV9QPN7_9GAMM
MIRWLLSSLLLCAACVATAAEKVPDASKIDVQLRLQIPMRDGVRLNANLYRPHAQAGKLPVLFCLNPYTADLIHPIGSYFAEHGYVFVAIDSRGRNGSGGVFRSWTHEARDGYDAVEWLARQPWSNGKVGMWGGSYLGFTQWTTLKEAPPHLRTIVPTASVRPGIDFPLTGGIFYSYDVQWLTFVSGVASNGALFGDAAFWRGKFAERYFGHAAFRTLDRIVGNPSEIFQDYLRHPSYDEHWQALAPNAAQYAAIDLPILTITGHWDDDQLGAMSYYREHMRHGSDAARAQHYLVIGPWDHSGTRRPQKELGGLKFGDASLLDVKQLHVQWYDWILKDGKKPDFLKQRVAYYVTGEEAWKYAGRLEDIAGPRSYYLSSDGGKAGEVFASGALVASPPDDQPPDVYVDDPLDVRPGRLELERGDVDATMLVDQTDAMNLRGAGVVYHGQALPEAVELSGTPKATLWISLDVPDVDFQATLHEIRPDGSAVALSSMMLRARYRESLAKAARIPPGEVLRYDFDRFNFVSRRLAQGSRLRLVVRAVNSLQFQKNYHSGGDVSDETAADARTAHVRIYHDREHPSAIELPLVVPPPKS